MPIEKFQKLNVWQEARQLVLLVYRHTGSFPDEERFALALQMRRAAISVMSNIAEGSKKRSVKERRRFHEIADTSLEELKAQAIVSADLHFIDVEKCDGILEQGRKVGGMLGALDKTLDRPTAYGVQRTA